jgi:hypothetical protein
MTANPPAQPPDTGAGPDSITNAMTALFESTTAQRGGADLEPGSVATPFSTFFWAALRYLNDGVQADRDTAEAQFADDIQWAMMNNGQVRKGKRRSRMVLVRRIRLPQGTCHHSQLGQPRVGCMGILEHRRVNRRCGCLCRGLEVAISAQRGPSGRPHLHDPGLLRLPHQRREQD